MTQEPHEDATPDVNAEPSATPEDAQAGDEPQEKQWWDDPSMPWRHEPGKADLTCMAWFAITAVYTLLLWPLRGWWIADHPDWLAMVSGRNSAVAATAARASLGQIPAWPIVIVIASVVAVAFDWVYWWAGKLWGRGIIEVWAGKSARSQRNYARAERWAEKFGWVGIFIAYIPVPLPLMAVVFVLTGATGMSLRRFLILDYIASTMWMMGYFALGWSLGEPAVNILNEYARYAGYVTLALLAFVIWTAVRQARQRGSES